MNQVIFSFMNIPTIVYTNLAPLRRAREYLTVTVEILLCLICNIYFTEFRPTGEPKILRIK